MEIRRWHLCIIVGCVLITHFEAKTVSLNKLIAAEAKQKEEKVLRTKSRDFEPKTVSPDALIAEESKQKQEKLPRTKFADTASAKPCSQKEALPAESQQRKHLHKADTASVKPRSQKEALPAELQQRKRLHKISAKSPRTQSISLKDFIAAEAKEHRRKLESFLLKSRGSGLLSNRRRLLPTLSFFNSESTESLFSRAKTQSPLNFQKTYEIKSPLRPKRLKHYFNPRYGRHAKSFKRETLENAKIRQKEIPIIRSLGLLVDDILSGSGESYEVKRPKRRRAKPKVSGARKEGKCKCNDEPDLEPADTNPDKKTVTIAPTVSLEVTTATEDTATETSSPTANNTTVSNVYTVRPDPNLSLLFTRNSTSRRRDYYGFSERSSPTLHRDVEGNIAGDNGNDEHNSRGERNQTCPPDNEENPCGSARNDASGVGPIARVYGNGNNPRDPDNRDETKKTKVSGNGDGFFRGDAVHEKAKEFQIGGETEETVQASGSARLRGTLPKLAIAMDSESVQPEKTGKESFLNVTHNFAGPERIAEWNGAPAAEDQRFRGAVETVNPMNSLYPTLLELNGSQNHIAPILVETATPIHSNPRLLEPNLSQNQINRILVETVTPKNSLNLNVLEPNRQPDQIVTIFDGYSVARDINGRNRFSEKSIHISS